MPISGSSRRYGIANSVTSIPFKSENRLYNPTRPYINTTSYTTETSSRYTTNLQSTLMLRDVGKTNNIKPKKQSKPKPDQMTTRFLNTSNIDLHQAPLSKTTNRTIITGAIKKEVSKSSILETKKGKVGEKEMHKPTSSKDIKKEPSEASVKKTESKDKGELLKKKLPDVPKNETLSPVKSYIENLKATHVVSRNKEMSLTESINQKLGITPPQREENTDKLHRLNSIYPRLKDQPKKGEKLKVVQYSSTNSRSPFVDEYEKSRSLESFLRRQASEAEKYKEKNLFNNSRSLKPENNSIMKASDKKDKTPQRTQSDREKLTDRSAIAATSHVDHHHGAKSTKSIVQNTDIQAGSSSSRSNYLSPEVRGLNGLRNIGNTCFMNSVLQCLSNSRMLLEYILYDRFIPDINKTRSVMKGALINSFAQLIHELWGVENEDRVVNTTGLKTQLQNFAPRFMGYSQQDAQEFLRYLLEGLHEDVNRVVNKPKPITKDIEDSISDNHKALEAWKRYVHMEDSKIVDIFVGQLKSTLQCTVCGHSSVTFDPFWDLSLPIPNSSSLVKLQACFSAFTREEVLDGDEKPTCSKCKTKRKCTKSFLIQKFPKILVLHLKRFSPNEKFRMKLSVNIDFPLNDLDLSPFAANKGQMCEYNLYAVSNHSGTTYSGHYTAYCKHPYSHTWHEYNDSRVSRLSKKSVVSSEAYVLFYELNI